MKIYNFGSRGYAALILDGFPKFPQSLKLQSSGWIHL